MDKSLKWTLSFFLISFILLGSTTQITYGFDWLDEAARDLEDWSDETRRDLEDWADETSRDVQDWSDETRRDAEEYWQQAEEWSEQTKADVEIFAREFTETASQNIQQAIETANTVTGAYREEAYNIISIEARRQMCEEYNNPAKVGELERKRRLTTEATIAAIKLVPIYDSEKKEIHTFDQFARDLYRDVPSMEGSDLSADPVRCATLMMLDSDYLMNAKIIKAPNGKWMSIRESQSVGYKTSDVSSAEDSYDLAREGYRTDDPNKIETGINEFALKINMINEEPIESEPEAPIESEGTKLEPEQSTIFSLPKEANIGIIAAIAMVVVALVAFKLGRRARTKST